MGKVERNPVATIVYVDGDTTDIYSPVGAQGAALKAAKAIAYLAEARNTLRPQDTVEEFFHYVMQLYSKVQGNTWELVIKDGDAHFAGRWREGGPGRGRKSAVKAKFEK